MKKIVQETVFSTEESIDRDSYVRSIEKIECDGRIWEADCADMRSGNEVAKGANRAVWRGVDSELDPESDSLDGAESYGVLYCDPYEDVEQDRKYSSLGHAESAAEEQCRTAIREQTSDD